MTLLIHKNDLEQHQQFLLAMFFYLWMIDEYDAADEADGIDMNESEAAEEAGELFDRLYHYDNSHDNITNALNWKNDD